MSEQQSSRHFPGGPPSGSSHKADSKLRLVGADGKVVIPDDAHATDSSPTIISRKSVKSLAEGITTGENLAGKNLYGQRLAHFELLEPIGVGGMAAVLRARDTQLDRFVALKILPPEMAEDEENIRRFHQEARAAAKLDHPNIAQAFFCGEDRGLHFIAFEFVEGDNLRTLMEKRGRLPVAESVRYIIQVALGLDHAAGRGVVHRDVKPSNIIITPHGAAKLVDMGLARSLEPQDDKGLTHSGMTLGTFDYISPEQALEPREADTRSDIYSLGCTFYHMLTGQPPVPEGTAAKKLYHHQHIAPVDPRQLNPAIPDEIASILMRMMCKDPAGRYQTPAHLIQHLMQVAEKVGAGANVPEGVMFLDAPLPGVPRFRPLLTISLAVLALGILLALISLAPNPKGAGQGAPGGPGQPGDRPNAAWDNTAPKAVDPLSYPPSQTVIVKQEEFEQAFALGNPSAVLGENVNVTTSGLTYDFQGKKSLVLKGRDKTRLNFSYQPADQDNVAPCLALNLEAGCSVVFENIRFELAGAYPEAMIAIRGPGQATFKKCTFAMKNVPKREKLTASVLVMNPVQAQNPTGDVKSKPTVTFDGCYFEQGQAAVAIEGPARVKANECAFGLHYALFHLRGSCPKDENGDPVSDLSLTWCSAFVVNGPAFRVDDNYFCTLKVNYSIFSNPNREGPIDAQLIYQTSKTDGPLVKFLGGKNKYHTLNGLYAWPGFLGEQTIDNFNAQIIPEGGKDVDSVVLTQFPWADSYPLLRLQEPRKAFQILQTMKEVRIAPTSTKAVGIEYCAWGKQDELEPLRSETTVKTPPLMKILDPEADVNDPKPNVYPSLAAALPYLKEGGVLYVKHGKNREVPIEAVEITDFDLTLRPYESYHPVLVFDKKPQQKPQKSIFRHNFNGKLQFENLEFLLEPDSLDVKSQAVVSLASGGQCLFKSCVFTLKRPDHGVQLAVATLLDVKDVKDENGEMMPNLKDPPQLSFVDCLVRGDGDMVVVKSRRALDLRIDNSLLALSGSAISLQGIGKSKDGKDSVLDLRTTIKLSRVSAFLTEPFIRGKKLENLVPVRCDAVQNNLFVQLTPKPFVTLEFDADKGTYRNFLEWRGEKNCYVRYESMLELKRAGDNMAFYTLDKKEWLDQDKEAQFIDAVFSLPAVPVFSELTLEHVKPQPSFEQQLANFLRPD